MRYLLYVSLPHEPFNTYTREGTVGQKISKIVEETKPEAIYFTEQDGQRGALAVHKMTDDSQIPVLAEPWFLTFKADCKFRIAMTADDLGKAGLDSLGKKWR